VTRVHETDAVDGHIFRAAVANALADNPRETMDTSNPKNVSEQSSESERAGPYETLFGYSRRIEKPTDDEGVDGGATALD
jgi:hypothetical protein